MNAPKEKAREVVIEHDALNEQIVVAAGIVDPIMRPILLRRIRPDRFFAKEHTLIWTGLGELERQKLEYDHATLMKLTGGQVPLDYLVGLVEARPTLPPNLEFHVGALLWDNARLTAVEGPIAGMLEALRDPRSEPGKVRALARQVAIAFDGYEERKFLLDGDELVRTQTEEIRKRAGGRAIYPFAGAKSPDLKALDFYEAEHEDRPNQPRLVPGAAPGLVTVVTGVSGSGKTTITANIVLGLARQRRKVLYGAWEVKGGMTLEVLACISLGWSRSFLLAGRCPDPGAPLGPDKLPPPIDESRVAIISERMLQLQKYVRFLENPFQRLRSEKKRTNEHNLDLLHGYIADAAADVFVGDLWERCLVFSRDESDERQALFRQQAMADETKCHCILLAQQRLKDIEQRADKRPTREGIKGSSAWVDIADTIIGIHNPGLWKEGAGDVLEIDILKQRYGRWPQAIEFDWSGDLGIIKNGRSVPYTQPSGDASDGFDDFAKPKTGRRVVDNQGYG